MRENESSIKCEEGAVCAWEYNGTLYRSQKERDGVIKEHKKRKLREAIIKLLHYRSHVERLSDTEYVVVNDPPIIDHIVRIEQVAEALINNWEYISSSIEELLRISKE